MSQTIILPQNINSLTVCFFQYCSFVNTSIVLTRHNLTPEQTQKANFVSARGLLFKICVCSGSAMGLLGVSFWAPLYPLKYEADPSFFLITRKLCPLYTPNTHVEIRGHFSVVFSGDCTVST